MHRFLITWGLSNQLYYYFTANNLFYFSQYGFRKNHFTECAVVEIVDRIITEMDKGKTPINIYLDLSKALDTLNHEILLHKLHHYGIKGKANELICSYFSNRNQYVKYKNENSEMLNITTRVPQGSIIGPLLFIIYINDISNSTEWLDCVYGKLTPSKLFYIFICLLRLNVALRLD